MEKLQRWKETVEWANSNGCTEIVTGIADHDIYFVDQPTSFAVGPAGGPMYRPWDFDAKLRPSKPALAHHFEALRLRWEEIVGPELASITRPLAFTGEKARRLLVAAKVATPPPWGGWSYLSPREAERRTFTRFRAAINKAVSPHEFDHIDFTDDAAPVVPGGAPQASCP